MKCLFFCVVFIVDVHSSDIKQKNADATNSTFKRIKRQDDRWSWGYVDVTDSNRNLEVVSTEEPNPCDPSPAPPAPDFSAPGRRISQVKCYDYIWAVKVREDSEKRSKECIEYLVKHSGPDGPHFAIGGRDALPGEFPHMGALGWKAATGTWIFKCGGSLISANFVLTAAHCSRASERDDSVADVEPKIVRLGDKNIVDSFANGLYPEDAEIQRVIVHPNYKPPKKYFDIALIELKNDVDITNFIQPACLYSGPDDNLLGLKATLTGWGVVETVGLTTSPDLQAAVVDVLNSSLCDKLLRPHCNRHWCGMQPDQLCAGKLAGGVDACQGDSGGPLQLKISLPNSNGKIHHIIGVTSFGIGCALPNLPGIYTRVSHFLDWIEEIVWK